MTFGIDNPTSFGVIYPGRSRVHTAVSTDVTQLSQRAAKASSDTSPEVLYSKVSGAQVRLYVRSGRAERMVASPSASTSPTVTSSIFKKQLSTKKVSTESSQTSDEIYLQLEAIFRAAKGEFFEDGMESAFSQQLISFIKRHASDAMEVITSLILYGRVGLEVAGEALRWIGRIEHPETYEYRRWLLEASLKLSSSYVKDGAILGLAAMDDKHAVPYLKAAIVREQCSELKADMEQVLKQLES